MLLCVEEYADECVKWSWKLWEGGVVKHPKIEPFLPRFPEELGGMYTEDIIYLSSTCTEEKCVGILNHELLHWILDKTCSEKVSRMLDDKCGCFIQIDINSKGNIVKEIQWLAYDLNKFEFESQFYRGE